MNNKQSMTSAAEVIRKRRKALYTKKAYISLLMRIIFLSLVVFILFTQVFHITRANGNDMFPAIKDGDLVLAYRLHGEYVKNDIAVYEVNNKTRMGRVVARETDVVTLDGSGTLFVNETVQEGEIMYPTLPKDGLTYPLEIGKSKVFILGDHRMESEDSRDLGPIELRNVKGKVITILRRRGL